MAFHCIDDTVMNFFVHGLAYLPSNRHFLRLLSTTVLSVRVEFIWCATLQSLSSYFIVFSVGFFRTLF